MTTLPEGLTRGRRTPTFTRATVPPSLTRAHLTATWAVVEVERGALTFVDEATGERVALLAGERHVIVPGQLHHVELDDDAAFAVQFWDD